MPEEERKKRRARRDKRREILQVLAREPELWWGMNEVMEVLKISSSTLYPSLHWLEGKAYVKGEFRDREDFAATRRLYNITPDGILALSDELPDW